MTTAFDPRLIKVTLTIENEQFIFDQRLYIRAIGEKFSAPNLGTGEIRIDNIRKNVRDFLISKTSLYTANASLPTPAAVQLDVGRASYGTFTLLRSQVIAGQPTQPPDIGVIFKTMSGVVNLVSTASIIMPSSSMLSAIASQVASSNGWALDFEATDKPINNYSYVGAQGKQMQKLQEMGNVDVILDNNTLVVKNSGTPRKGSVPLISPQTGLIGIPYLTDRGVSCRTLINNEVRIGGSLDLQSEVNPSVNGVWKNISRLGFDIASWETPFYWDIEANQNPIFGYS